MTGKGLVDIVRPHEEEGELAAVEAWRVENPCTGTESFLHESNWYAHLDKHPELDGHLDSTRDTVSDPDFAIVNDEGTIFKYRRGYGRGRTHGLWLVALEKPLEREHPVMTAYFTKELVQGSVLCIRRLPQRGV